MFSHFALFVKPCIRKCRILINRRIAYHDRLFGIFIRDCERNVVAQPYFVYG